MQRNILLIISPSILQLCRLLKAGLPRSGKSSWLVKIGGAVENWRKTAEQIKRQAFNPIRIMLTFLVKHPTSLRLFFCKQKSYFSCKKACFS